MRKNDLIKTVSSHTGCSIRKSAKIIQSLLNVIGNSLKEGEDVALRNFGTFKISEKNERRFHNISTREIAILPKQTKVKFIPSKQFKRVINQHQRPIVNEKSFGPIKLKDAPQVETAKEEHVTMVKKVEGIVPAKPIVEEKHVNRPSVESKINVVGKIDLDNLNQQTCPKKKSTQNYDIKDSNIDWQTSNKDQCRKTIPTAKKNRGKRRTENVTEFHNNDFKYVGIVDYDHYLGENDHKSFPSIKTPCKGTKILNCYKSNKEAVVGVTEPLLMAEVEKLCQKFDGLILLKGVALPILNRIYSYIPDIALYWGKYNIYVDIEIDEPYDICSHTPLHYIGCSDNLRDSYFTRNGWCVVRYSEHQVLHYRDEIIKHLEFVLTWLSGKSSTNYSIFEEKRWTYEEAEHMAKSAEREKDLEVGVNDDYIPSTELNKSLDSHNDTFIKPDKDILPKVLESSHNSIIESQLNYVLGSDAQYVRITNTDGNQWILEKDTIQIKIEEGCKYVIGDNPIDPYLSSHEYRLNTIEQITSLPELFTAEHWQYGNLNSVKENLVKAASNGSPIWIRYKNSKGEISARFLSNVCLCCGSIKTEFPFTELGYVNALGANRRIYIYGLCSIRNEFRTFTDDRLLEVKIVNCKNNFIYPKVYQNTLAELVLNPHIYNRNFFDRVDYLLKIMPDYEKKTLISQGNMANYEVIKGNIGKAFNLYKSISFDKIVYTHEDVTYTWGRLCIDDIERYIHEYKEKENYNHYDDISFPKLVENFIQVKDLLIKSGWEWPDN